MNLPKDLREKREGHGTIRSLSRGPRDLKQPMPSHDGEIDCTLQTVEFPEEDR